MVFIWPLSLVGLLAAAAVAVWALLRPGRQEAIVGSLAVWQKALATLDRSAKRSSRRVSAAWLMLAGGAVAGILGLARPVLQTQGYTRSVAVSLAPSAELGRAGLDEMTAAARRLLARMDAGDRVRLVLPACLGGTIEPLSPADADGRISQLPLLPAAAGDLAIPPAPRGVEHVYRFAPAALDAPAGPRTTVIAISPHLPALTIDAIGAAPVVAAPAVTAGQVEIYVAVRSHADAPRRATLRVEGLRADLTAWQPRGQIATEVPAGGREGFILRAAADEALRVTVISAEGAILDAAHLARVSAVRRKVALVGRDEPLLRRFIRADHTLELVGSPNRADLVLANLAEPPPDKPALVIDPPRDPPGWQRGQRRRAVTLADANIAADEPLLRGVGLSGVAVRRLRPWVPLGASAMQPLVSVEGGAVVLASEPRVATAGGGGPARIYVAFELSGDNTNLGTSEAFVVFLANAVRRLAPGGKAETTYECVSPSQAPRSAAWKPVTGSAPPPAGAVEAYTDGPLPAPGVYVDQAQRLRAVSLVGLRGEPTVAGSPASAVASAPLPEPQAVGEQFELWPLLALAAMALWLVGWALRMR